MSRRMINIERLLNSKGSGRVLKDDKNTYHLFTGRSCEPDAELREKWGLTDTKPVYSSIVHLVSDADNDVNVQVFTNRTSPDNKLIRITNGYSVDFDEYEDEYYALLTKNKDGEYTIQYAGLDDDETGEDFPEEFQAVPLLMSYLDDPSTSDSFKDAYSIMTDNNKPASERAYAAGVVSDQFSIYMKMISDKVKVSFDEFTPSMANRFIQTGEYFDKLSTVNVITAPSGGLYDLDKAMNGDYRVDYDWTDEERAMIPSLEEDVLYYDPIKDFQSIFAQVNRQLRLGCKFLDDNQYTNAQNSGRLRNGMAMNILLSGDPGTGKTATARAIAGIFGLPLYTQSFSKHTDENEIRGQMSISGATHGKPQFVRGGMVDVFENGGVILLDEFNLCDPGVAQGVFSSALERPYKIEVDRQTVYRHPFTIFVGTRNLDLAGTKDSNFATLGRFNFKTDVQMPGEEQCVKIVTSMMAEPDEKLARLFYGYCMKAREYFKENYSDLRNEALNLLTVRQMADAANIASCPDTGYSSPEEALRTGMLNSLLDLNPSLEDVNIVDEVYDAIV